MNDRLSFVGVDAKGLFSQGEGNESVHCVLQLLHESSVREVEASCYGDLSSHVGRCQILRKLVSLAEMNEYNLSLLLSEDAIGRLVHVAWLLPLARSQLQTKSDVQPVLAAMMEERRLIVDLLCRLLSFRANALCDRLVAVLPDVWLLSWLLCEHSSIDDAEKTAFLFNAVCSFDPKVLSEQFARSGKAVERLVSFLASYGNGANTPTTESCRQVLSAVTRLLTSDRQLRESIGETSMLIDRLVFGGINEEMIRIIGIEGDNASQSPLALCCVEVLVSTVTASEEAFSLFVQMGLLAKLGKSVLVIPREEASHGPVGARLRTDQTTGNTMPNMKEKEQYMAHVVQLSVYCIVVSDRVDTANWNLIAPRDRNSRVQWPLSRAVREQMVMLSPIAQHSQRLLVQVGSLLASSTAQGGDFPLIFENELVAMLCCLLEKGGAEAEGFYWLSRESEVSTLNTIVTLATLDLPHTVPARSLVHSCLRLTYLLLGRRVATLGRACVALLKTLKTQGPSVGFSTLVLQLCGSSIKGEGKGCDWMVDLFDLDIRSWSSVLAGAPFRNPASMILLLEVYIQSVHRKPTVWRAELSKLFVERAISNVSEFSHSHDEASALLSWVALLQGVTFRSILEGDGFVIPLEWVRLSGARKASVAQGVLSEFVDTFIPAEISSQIEGGLSAELCSKLKSCIPLSSAVSYLLEFQRVDDTSSTWIPAAVSLLQSYFDLKEPSSLRLWIQRDVWAVYPLLPEESARAPTIPEKDDYSDAFSIENWKARQRKRVNLLVPNIDVS